MNKGNLRSLGASFGSQDTRRAFRPAGTILDPFAQYANLVFGQTDVLARHQFRMRATALHSTDQQAAIWVLCHDVGAAVGAALKGTAGPSEIESGRW